MSHEVIRVIILVKYINRSHEMIQVTYKRLLTTVNKEITQGQTDMKWCGFGSESPSGLHCTKRYESPDHPVGSVFESPVYQVHNGHKSESPVTEFGSHERVRNAATRNHTRTPTCYTYTPINRNVHTYIHNTHAPTHKHNTNIIPHIIYIHTHTHNHN